MKTQNILNSVRANVGAALTLWFVFALVMGASGQYVSGTGKPPLLLGLTLIIPPMLFALAYLRHGAFWTFCQALDLRLLTLLHLWRIAGLDFLLNYLQGHLPAGFAFPAGIGDVVIALTAIPLVLVLSSKRASAGTWFVAWNLFGLVDLIVAVGSGILHSQSSFGILAGSGPTTLLMSEFPRSLIPTFFVPLFILLHLLALSRSREVIAGRTSIGTLPTPASPSQSQARSGNAA